MKRKLSLSLVMLVASMPLLWTQDQSVKDKYLKQRVVVTSSAMRRAVLRNGTYELVDSTAWIPDSYIGKPATVIALQPRPGSGNDGKKNALGEPVQSANVFDTVIQFDDGLLAMALGVSLLVPEKQYQAQHKGEQEEQSKNELWAQSLLGKNLYATAVSRVFRSDAALSEMRASNPDTLYVPLLQPMPVTAAIWNQAMGCAIVKIGLPGGASGLALASPAHGNKGSDCVLHGLVESTSSLTPSEITAIQGRTLVRGMSETALQYAIGYPVQENDYGSAGRQLIYPSDLFVYVDTRGRVIDWQKMGER